MTAKQWYRFSSIIAGFFLAVASLGWFIPPSSSAEARQAAQQPDIAPTTDQSLLATLRSRSAGHATVAYHDETGRVRFIGTDLDHSVAPANRAVGPLTSEQAALGFVSEYGALFGLRDPQRELQLRSSQLTDNGRSFVRYQQVYQGIPVLGGELIVQTDRNRNLLSINGEILPSLELDTTPRISAAGASQKALTAIAKTHRLATTDLAVSQPELWIFNPALLGGPGPRINAPVWRMEVVATNQALPIREMVLIDARIGVVALHFNQIAHAKNRVVCNTNSVPDNDGNPNNNCDEPAEYVRTEGQAATGVTDVDLAYDFAGITYDYLSSQFGRDSLDNNGLPLISVVNYCPDADNCPFANAFWNGRQMTYGAGYASADDVVGHELAHGLTEFTAGLFYYYQSGAINESISDVFGELIDLTDGRGNDSASVRWKIGEDLTIGAIRDMSNPGLFADPDRTGSSDYYGGTEDNGGVHFNSGVNNKAAFLMVDGGTFNGRTVTALGIAKVGQIYYEALSRMMTSASDYKDLYNYLQQACTNLVGSHGITSADCQEVRDAVEATEMHLEPANAPTQNAALCPDDGSIPLDAFYDNLENPASGNWASSAAVGANEWYYPSSNTPYGSIVYATSGKTNIWGNDQGGTHQQPLPAADYSIAMTRNVVVPASGYLHFNHSYGFEADFFSNYDGGVVEYSVNNGQTWLDAGQLFVDHGYNGTIEDGENPLGGRQGFVDHSNGYGSSRLNLSSLAGQSIRFRFRIGTDTLVDEYGWFIDDVRIYSCGTLPPGLYLPLVKR